MKSQKICSLGKFPLRRFAFHIHELDEMEAEEFVPHTLNNPRGRSVLRDATLDKYRIFVNSIFNAIQWA